LNSIKIINFAHPFTKDQLDQIRESLGCDIEIAYQSTAQFDHQAPFPAQVDALLESIPISGNQWQTERLLINLPSLNVIAALMLANLHGRIGHFPTVIRLKPRENATPPVFDLAEILNLNQMRENARRKRSE
jgi:hypothetical protein